MATPIVLSKPQNQVHESAWRGVMAADASMDVADNLLALGDGDASLQKYSSLARTS